MDFIARPAKLEGINLGLRRGDVPRLVLRLRIASGEQVLNFSLSVEDARFLREQLGYALDRIHGL